MDNVGLYAQVQPRDRDQAIAMSAASLDRRVNRLERQQGYIAPGSLTGGTGGSIAPLSITAAEIAVGTITASQIAVGGVAAANISSINLSVLQAVVTNLSVLSANMGTITAGTITGATMQSAASGARWVGDSTGIRLYDPAGVVTFAADTSTGKITTLAGIGSGNSLWNSRAQNGTTDSGFVSSDGGAAPTLTASTTVGRSSLTSFRLTSNGGGPDNWFALNSPLATRATRVNPGEVWSGSLYVMPGTTARSCRAAINFFNAAGGFLSVVYGSASSEVSGAWSRRTVTATVPANAATAILQFLVTSAPSGEYHSVTDMQLEQGDLVTGYGPRPDEILPSTVTTTEIATGTVTLSNLNTGSFSSLSAITANLGTITAGTITGATVQTATGTGARVVFDSTGIKAYNSSNVNTLTIASSDGSFTATSGTITGATIQTSASTSVARTILDGTGFRTLNAAQANQVTISPTTGVQLATDTATAAGRELRWVRAADGSVAAQLYGSDTGSPGVWGPQYTLSALPTGGTIGSMSILAADTSYTPTRYASVLASRDGPGAGKVAVDVQLDATHYRRAIILGGAAGNFQSDFLQLGSYKGSTTTTNPFIQVDSATTTWPGGSPVSNGLVVTFPTAFAATPLVVATAQAPVAGTVDIVSLTAAPTTTTASFRVRKGDGTSPAAGTSVTVFWFAVGTF